jgi:hypothetical protein
MAMTEVPSSDAGETGEGQENEPGRLRSRPSSSSSDTVISGRLARTEWGQVRAGPSMSGCL